MAIPFNQGLEAEGQVSGALASALSLFAEHGISLDAAAVVISVGGGASLEAPPVVPPEIGGEGSHDIEPPSAAPPVQMTSAADIEIDLNSDGFVIDLTPELAEGAAVAASSGLLAGGDHDRTDESDGVGLAAECWAWMRGNLHWYAISTVVHLALFGLAIVVLGKFLPQEAAPIEEVTFVPADFDDYTPPPLANFEFPRVDPDRPPSALDAAALQQPESRTVKRQYNDNGPDFSPDPGGRESQSPAGSFGGAGGFNVKASGSGPKVAGHGGIAGESGHIRARARRSRRRVWESHGP